MSKVMKVFVVLALVGLTVMPAAAQSKMWAGIGGDVLFPMGDFGDAYSVGFGATARFQYNFMPQVAAGAELGYLTWSGKDVEGVSLPSYGGVPFRVFGKYYFMPSTKALRVYGFLGLGLMFGSSGDTEVTIPGFGTTTVEGGSSTDFNLVPEVGIEYPLSADGRTQLDGSLRYDLIFTEGSSSGSIGLRIGVNFALGQ